MQRDFPDHQGLFNLTSGSRSMGVDIILFGDQTADYKPILTDSLSRKGFPLLTFFTEQAGSVIREEIKALPKRWRDRTPPFSNVQELMEREYDPLIREAALDSAMTSLAQLAYFIRWAKHTFEFVRSPDSASSIFESRPLNYPKPANSRIIGICTGVLAAAAVASCDSLTSLIPLAVEVVRIAFRVGHCVARMADMLEQGPSGRLSWSTVVLGVGGSVATTAVETFNLEQVCHPLCS